MPFPLAPVTSIQALLSDDNFNLNWSTSHFHRSGSKWSANHVDEAYQNHRESQ